MPTPDRTLGPSQEEGTYYEDNGIAATAQGEVRYTGGAFSLYDSLGAFNPRSGGSGITEGQHENLDTLTHNLAETLYEEPTYTDGQVSAITWWTNSGKTTKIREELYTRTNGQVSQIVLKHYDGTGALITGQTITKTVTRTGGRVTYTDWVQS
jgi:hypothetical protein